MKSDPKQLWSQKHKSAYHLADGGPTAFAVEVDNTIPRNATILELGCGHGQDAWFLAQQGHDVTATDFSEEIIAKNKTRHQRESLSFGVLDISKPMTFANEVFDVIYASFSLHYFVGSTTQLIFKELARVLKPEGYLCFICKSTKDFYYGKGRETEKDVYEFNGEVKHFFSEDYVKECLANDFIIESLESGEKTFFSYPAAYVKTIARKAGNNS